MTPLQGYSSTMESMIIPGTEMVNFFPFQGWDYSILLRVLLRQMRPLYCAPSGLFLNNVIHDYSGN